MRAAAMAALAVWTGAAAAGPAHAAPLVIRAGAGTRLVIEQAPFRLALVDRGNREEVGTVPATATDPPLRMPGIDGPQPVEPLGAAGGFPALGWVVGTAPQAANPAPPFTGNRLLGAEAGAIVSVVAVDSAARSPEGGLRLALRTDVPALGDATLQVTPLRAGGVALALEKPTGLTNVVSALFTLRSPRDEALYGTGDRRDAFDQRGLLRNMWVEEQYFGDESTEPLTGADPTGLTGPAYTAPNGAQMAFYVAPELSGSRGWTAWVESAAMQRLDLAHSRGDAIRWGVAGDRLDLALAGGGLERSVRAYTARAGRAPAPPDYVLAPWLDRINQNGEGEAAPNGGGYNGGPAVRAFLLDAVARIRRLDLPISTFGVEGWQEVPGRETLFPQLRGEGFDLVAYWNPYLAPKKPATDAAIKLHVTIEDARGEPYPIVTNRQNVSYAVDFSNPRAQAFWDEQIERSCSLGFEGTHADFGEFVIQGMQFADGTPWELMHNRYPLLYARATRAALAACARRHHVGPFFYVRSGYGRVPDAPATLSQTPAVIVGDESTDFSRGSGLASLPPAMLNLALAGGSVFISDIGGYFDLYTQPTTAELFTRWAQLAALTPVMRIHDDTIHGSLYPWSFDAATLDAYRRYARLHVRLRPLFRTWLRRGARNGAIGPVRPLVLDDHSPAARGVGDEWLLGRDLLVAPILKRGAVARSVYLPAGRRWRQVRVDAAGRLVGFGPWRRGGRSVTAPAPLSDIPLFVARRRHPPR
jgi:alpha-glucosidase